MIDIFEYESDYNGLLDITYEADYSGVQIIEITDGEKEIELDSREYNHVVELATEYAEREGVRFMDEYASRGHSRGDF